MKNYNVIVSTVERPNKSPYLDRCIESIRQDYKGIIHLVIGGENTSYTDKYTKGFVKHYIHEEEKKLSNNIQRAALGYYTALNIDKNQPCLILEDDGELVEDWNKKLDKLIDFTNEDKYIISLISPGHDSVPEPNIDIPSLQKFIYRGYLDYKTPGYPVSTVITYCNTTGVYYPTSMLSTRLAEFVYKYAVEGDAVYDIVIGQYLFRHNLSVNIAVPNLLKEVDSNDTSLGHLKKPSTKNYDSWDFTRI